MLYKMKEHTAWFCQAALAQAVFLAKKQTKDIIIKGEFVKKETEEKTIELEKVVPLLKKLKTSNVDNSVYSEIKDLATLDKGIFFFSDGGITYEDERYYSRCNFIYSYTMTDTDVADYWTALNNLFGE